MSNRSDHEPKGWFRWSVGWLAAVALLALRLPHLAGPLDDPHSWRQCDTAFYSLDFYRHGTDLLRPPVCWLGPHRTLVLEFPLPEALSAQLYRLFGPDPLWDRVVSLAFFAAAAAYLRAFVRLVAGPRVAGLGALAYLAFPLGQFYSRAAHVDFAATAFAHAMLFHSAIAMMRGSLAHGTIAGGCGALAALIKAPYLIPVVAPLGLVALSAPGLSTAALGALSVAPAAVAFALWRRHVDAVNGAAPDWDFLPGYYKESNPLWWYVGSLAQRLEASSWVKVARRLVYEVATPWGSALALLGLWPRPARGRFRCGPVSFAMLWAVACLAYLCVFFPLNVIHNYYQLPFLAPAALLVALGADRLWDRLPRWRRFPIGSLAFVAFLGLAVWAVRPLGYYRVDWLRVEAGRLIAERVPAGDLIVVSDHGSVHSDPRLLFRADRLGWPLAMGDLEPWRLARLALLGARWVAVVTSPEHPELFPPGHLEPGLVDRVPVLREGRAIGTLALYDLARALEEPGATGPGVQP